MPNKNECQALYRELKRDFGDLNSASFKKHWLSRAYRLKELGCWFHYMILKRKAREYLNGEGDYYEL